MLFLGINTATDRTEVAVIDGGKIVFQKQWTPAHNEAEKIFPVLKIALNKIGKKSPEKIFIVEGPGAFTGLRIGVTVANTLAFRYGVSVVSCTTFDYLKMKLPAARTKNTAVILKGGGDHCAVAIPGSKKIHRMEVSELESFLKKKKSIRYGIGEKKLIPKSLKLVVPKELKSLAEVLLEISKKKTQSKKLVKPYYLNPPHITKSKKKVFA